MAEQARKRATYEDVLAAPAHMVAELVDGTLYTMSRPRLRHASAASGLGGLVHGPFHRGQGGPGGWIILDEPELHFGADVFVPDLAGWRRERMPEVPDEPFTTLAPDWCCEVLSPTTRSFDRLVKVPRYAQEAVPHVWLVDVDAKLVEVLRLDGDTYRLVATHGGDAEMRAEPFEALPLPLAALWA